jgi:DNA invertase Pin-like site-specific DNA recombinase
LKEIDITKLTEKQREEIRKKYAPQGKGKGKGNASALAKEYGVSRKTIHVIVNEGKTSLHRTHTEARKEK